MRAKNASDLLHVSERPGREKVKTASVTMELRVQKGKETYKTTFRREITKGGEKETISYKCFLNNEVTTKDKYLKALRKLNIVPHARNFIVQQGEVAAIARRNPKEIAALIDEISTTPEDKAKYDAAKKEFDEAQKEVADKGAAVRGVRAEKNVAQMAAKDAGKYKEAETKKNELRLQRALLHLHWIETQMKKLSTDHAKAVAEREAAMGGETAKKELEDIRGEFQAAHAKVVSTQGKYQELRVQSSADDNSIARAKATIEHNQGRIKKIDDEKTALEEARAKLDRSRTVLANNSNAINNDKRQNESQAEGDEKPLSETLTSDQLAIWESAKSEAQKLTVSIRQELDRLNGEVVQLRVTADGARAASAMDSHRLEELNNALTQLDERRKTLQNNEAKILKDLEDAKKSQKRSQDAMKRAQNTRGNAEEKLKDVAGKLAEMRFDKHDMERETNIRETVEQLKAAFPEGVKGRITELVKITKSEYKVAVTVAMGRAIEGVVVADEATGLACINYLRTNRRPPMLFIPLDSVQVTKPAAVARAIKNCTPALDCLQYDRQYEPAAAYAVGATLICRTFADAIAASGGNMGVDGTKHKVVTLDGTVIRKNGVISGGQATVARRAEKRWEVAQYDEAKKLRDELMSVVVRAQEEASIEQEKLGRSEQEVLRLTADAGRATADLKAIEAKILAAEKDVDMMKEKRDKSSKPAEQRSLAELARAERAVEDKQRELRAEMQKHVAAAEGKIGQSGLVEKEETANRKAEERRTKSAQYDRDLSRLKNQIEFIARQIDEGDERVKQLVAEKRKFEKDLEVGREKLKNADDQIERRAKELKAAEVAYTKAKEDFANVQSNFKKIKDKLDLQGAKTEGIRRTIKQKEHQMEELRHRRVTHFRRIEADSIEIPMIGKDEKPGEKRVREEGEEEEEEQGGRRKRKKDAEGAAKEAGGVGDVLVSEPMTRVGEAKGGDLRIDFTFLPPALRRVTSDLRQFQKQLHEHDQQIIDQTAIMERIAPTAGAQSRADAAKGSVNDHMRDYNDAKTKMQKALTTFQLVREARKRMFLASFEAIKKNLGPIYERLTTGGTGTGGIAFMTADASEEPYFGEVSFGVIPPGKRFTGMNALSGGEKTIAALALLFAVHRAVPPPFLILDEVDAALDARNVQRVLQYIEQSKRDRDFHCQFLVISLKAVFFSRADSLIGIYKHKREGTRTSACVTMNVDHTTADEE